MSVKPTSSLPGSRPSTVTSITVADRKVSCPTQQSVEALAKQAFEKQNPGLKWENEDNQKEWIDGVRKDLCIQGGSASPAGRRPIAPQTAQEGQPNGNICNSPEALTQQADDFYQSLPRSGRGFDSLNDPGMPENVRATLINDARKANGCLP